MKTKLTVFAVFVIFFSSIVVCGGENKDRRRRAVDVQNVTIEKEVPIKPTESLGTTLPDTKTSDKGSIYIRWGRTDCPEDGQHVYSGVAGGSHQSHKGGGANYLCLTNDPIWGDYNDAVANSAFVYGAEYETGWPLHDDNIKGNTHVNQDVPCAVCWTRGRSSNLMIPGRNECHGEGWHLEYHGYLMSDHHTHPRREYVCMDLAPEADPAGYENKDGALFYYVEAACGSLPCPPYVNGREITCVVCSK